MAEVNFDDAAIKLGIGANYLRSIVKKTGMKARLRRRGRSIVMSREDIAEVDEWLRNNRPRAEENRRRLLIKSREAKERTATAKATPSEARTPRQASVAREPIAAAATFDLENEGLPLTWWGNPRHREAFHRLRLEREARLIAMVAAAGL